MFTLRFRLWCLILVAVAPVLAAQVYTLAQLQDTREVEAVEDALSVAKQISAETDRIVEGTRGILIALSELPFVRRLDAEQCSHYLGDLLRRYPQVNSISVVNREGLPLCTATPVLRTVNLSDRFYFQDALANGFSIGSYVVGRFVRQPALPFAQRIENEDGEMLGVAVIHLDLIWLNEYFKKKLLPANVSATLADRHGVVVASTDPGAAIGSKLAAELVPILESNAEGVTEHAYGGQRRIVAYTPIEAPPRGIWTMASVPKAAVIAEAQKASVREISLTGALAILALILAGLIGELWIRAPILKVVSEGDD